MNKHLKYINVQMKCRKTVGVTNTLRTGILETAYVLNGIQYCTVLNAVKYVGCFQDTAYQVPSHLYKYRTNK